MVLTGNIYRISSTRTIANVLNNLLRNGQQWFLCKILLNWLITLRFGLNQRWSQETIVSCATSFLQSLPAFYSLSRSARNYLLRVNLRPLIFPNLHELTQNCYAEPWQVESFAATWQMMCGAEVYPDFRQVERLMDHHIVNDPVVTRLWMIILFFSTPLHYHNDGQIVTPLLKKKSVVMDAQNAYATLIWKYLLYRHQEHEAVRIYSDLIRVYLKMQHVGFQIYLQLRSKQELAQTHDALQKLILAETDEHRETTTTQWRNVSIHQSLFSFLVVRDLRNKPMLSRLNIQQTSDLCTLASTSCDDYSSLLLLDFCSSHRHEKDSFFEIDMRRN